ncbi:PH domain-containing protein [Populibacterium corticicola]|uniref:PH domain-containing protein n=1 Tax=Populibacterium corticicola TaxID=1812826 RepID=A0ABW5XJ95_9MICO
MITTFEEQVPVPRDEWVPVSRDWFKAKMRTMMWCLVVLCPLLAIPYFIWGWSWLLYFPGGLLALCLLGIPFDYFEVKNLHFMVREDEILVRRGALSRSTTAMPYGRIQRVDTEEGPIDRRYGLAQITFSSAGAGDLTIDGLPAQRAQALRDEVLAAAELRRVEL